MSFLKISGKTLLFARLSLSCVLSVCVVSMSTLLMNGLCCSSCFLLKISSCLPFSLVTGDEIQFCASGSTRSEVLQATPSCQISFSPDSVSFFMELMLLLRQQGSAQKEEELSCTHTGTHLFNHLFCFPYLHTDKYSYVWASMLLFVTVVDLEHLLDVLVSNSITLIWWEILLVCRNLHCGMYLLAWSKLKRYHDYFLFWDLVVTYVRFLEVLGQAGVSDCLHLSFVLSSYFAVCLSGYNLTVRLQLIINHRNWGSAGKSLHEFRVILEK